MHFHFKEIKLLAKTDFRIEKINGEEVGNKRKTAKEKYLTKCMLHFNLHTLTGVFVTAFKHGKMFHCIH